MEYTINKQVFEKRIEKCNQLMINEDLDLLLLTKPSNMYFLTGDGRLCAYTMITVDGQVALGVPETDKDDVRELARFDHLATFRDEIGMIHSIANFFKQFEISKGTVGMEYTFLTKSMLGMMTHPHAKPDMVTVKDCTNILSQMRMIKEPIEIKLMQEAAKIADIGMEAAIASIKAGITESQIAGEGEYAMRQAGAEGFWRSYVASGIRTRIAHGIPTNYRVQVGDIIMIDFHPIVNNYSSDICRMACVGKPSTQQLKAYEVYLEALKITIAKAITGIGMVELEKTLHGVIQDAGYGNNIFGPPIHGIGINFEEAPLPPGHAFFHGEKAPPPLVKNIPIAIGNCGIYTKTWGVRIEDTVVIGKDKPLTLTSYPYDLEKVTEL
ncbi:MAG: M24 family metallopeptidase [Candidatus Hermodarchaeota archaeon]